MGRRGPRIERFLGQDLDRLEALSDGVFAFAMTLLAFEIRVPDPISITSEERLWAALVALAPRLVTYAMSFLTLGIFWNAQQAHLHHLRASDRTFTWIQLTFTRLVGWSSIRQVIDAVDGRGQRPDRNPLCPSRQS
jgi:uncharacterized membrane protein